MRRAALVVLACAGALQLSAGGCALRPAWQALAIDGGLAVDWVDSGRFRHLALSNGLAGQHLRIYVEGDGTPWIRGVRVSVDPTPADPLLLRLMHDADHPAVYLGRPCYFGTASDPNCGSRLWTVDRYGVEVIGAMCDAANRVIDDSDARTVQLIGYSGGGVIVSRMRACTNRLVEISTVAANLDPGHWAAHHGYTPLGKTAVVDGPARVAGRVSEVHWQCTGDTNVPPAVTETYFESNPHAQRRLVDDCTHSTGWSRYWSEIIGL